MQRRAFLIAALGLGAAAVAPVAALAPLHGSRGVHVTVEAFAAPAVLNTGDTLGIEGLPDEWTADHACTVRGARVLRYLDTGNAISWQPLE